MFSRGGGDDNDLAPPRSAGIRAGLHDADRFLAGHQHAFHVDIHHLVPLRHVQRGERADPQHSNGANQRIQPAPMRRDVIDRVRQVGAAAYVAGESEHLNTLARK